MKRFESIAQLREANKAIGNHWFDRATMRFFATRIESSLYDGRYFITSDKTGFGEERGRKYTIREARERWVCRHGRRVPSL